MREFYRYEIKKAILVKLDEVHGVAEIVEFEPGKEDYHDYISYEDGLDLVRSDHRFIEKKLGE